MSSGWSRVVNRLPSREPSAVPEDPLGRRSLIGDSRVGTGDQDDIRRVLHESLEPRFTATRVKGFAHRLAADGHCCLRAENLDRTPELEGEPGGTCDDYQPLQMVLGDQGTHELFRQLVLRGAATLAIRLDDIALHVAVGQALSRGRPQSRQALLALLSGRRSIS